MSSLASRDFEKLKLIKKMYLFLLNLNPRDQIEINFQSILWDQLIEQVVNNSLTKLLPTSTLKEKNRLISFPRKIEKLRNTMVDEKLGDLYTITNTEDIINSHKHRNLIQHDGRDVSKKDFTHSINIYKNFIQIMLKHVFGLQLSDIHLLAEINNLKLRDMLNWAYEELNNQDFGKALAWGKYVHDKIIESTLNDFGFDTWSTHHLPSNVMPMPFPSSNIELSKVEFDISKISNWLKRYDTGLSKSLAIQIGISLSSNTKNYLEIVKLMDKTIPYSDAGLKPRIKKSEILNPARINEIIDEITSMCVLWSSVYDIEIRSIKNIERENLNIVYIE